MMANSPSHSFDVVVLGAGISGLTVAYYAALRGFKVLLADQEPRVGGVIHSEVVDGYLLERGPNSFTSAPEIDKLIAQIGLGSRAIRRPLRDYDRYVYKGGALRRVPTGPLELLRTDALSFSGKLKLLSGLFAHSAPPRRDLSLGEYFRPRIGNEAVDTLLRPFIAGVYAADADRLSFEAALPRLYKPATRNPRLLGAVREMMKSTRKPAARKTQKSLVSFPDGLEELPRRLALVAAKRGVSIKRGAAYEILRRENGHWVLGRKGEAEISARHVVLAMPAWSTAKALRLIAPQLAASLDEIRYARLTVLHAGISAWDVRAREKGFGFLNAQLPSEWKNDPHARVRALGMIWSDQIFPGRAPRGMRLYTCFYGGEKDPQANDLTDSALERQLCHDMEKVLRLRPGTGPTMVEITRWKRALPIFKVGQIAHVNPLLENLPPGIHPLASYQGGVSMPDRVAKALQLAKSL